MRRTNINAVMRMVKRYLSGEMDAISFKLDFPYEPKSREIYTQEIMSQ